MTSSTMDRNIMRSACKTLIFRHVSPRLAAFEKPIIPYLPLTKQSAFQLFLAVEK